MALFARLEREIRFIGGMARTLWAVRDVAPDSDVLICDDWEAACAKYADHTALEFEGEHWTYRQLDAVANRFAAWGLAQGVTRGDAVALLLPNRAEYVPAWMGPRFCVESSPLMCFIASAAAVAASSCP